MPGGRPDHLSAGATDVRRLVARTHAGHHERDDRADGRESSAPTPDSGIAPQIDDLPSVLARPDASRVPYDVKRAWLWLPPSNTYASRFSRQQVPWFESKYALLQRTVAAMSAAGVVLIAGTDTPTASVIPGVSLHDELDELVRAGLSPYAALRTATVDAARFLGVSDSGTVAVGQRADVLMVRGNPLADIRAVRDVSAVCTNGHWRDRAALKHCCRRQGGEHAPV